VIAFAWTALRPDDMSLQASLKLNRARNWQEFLDGARDAGSPQQNIVYADIDGNIGFVAPARIPIRKPENDLKGLAPAPGWDARYDWDGFIPFDQLPRQYNPASQRIITANQKIVADDYPYFLTSEWTLPYRANRITELINAKPMHSMSGFAAIQKDHVSLAAQELLPILSVAHPRSERAKTALSALRKWTGAMDADRSEPLIFNAWVREASRQIFADELGDALMHDYWEQRNVHQPMVNVLKNTDGQSRWCADIRNATPVRQQSCDDVLSASLETTLNDLETRYGSDMSTWRWGDAHVARSEHRPFGKIPLLAKIFDIRIATPGDTFTVNVGRHNLRDEKEPFANRHAASLRALYDLSNLEDSLFIHSTGQSGNVFSPLYRNYAQRWADVSYLPMKTKREEVEKQKLGSLTLTP
jgi:penicillin amidase